MNTSDGTGTIPKMKYCKCVKPKEWEGDNYCIKCRGFIESRINTKKIKMFRYVGNGKDTFCLLGLHYYATNARLSAERLFGISWKELYNNGARIKPVYVTMNESEGTN